MKGGDGIKPALLQQHLISLAHMRQEKGIIAPVIRVIDITLSRNDIEIVGEDDRDMRPTTCPSSPMTTTACTVTRS